MEAKRRLDEELAFEHAANGHYEHYRATARDSLCRKLSSYNRRTTPYEPPLVPEGKVNVTERGLQGAAHSGTAEHPGV